MIKRKIAIVFMLLVLPLSSALFLSSCASKYHQESAGEYIDSSVITTKVKAKLLKDESIKSLPITVNTYKSTVQLSGFVDNLHQKQKAGKIARNVEGVTEVQNLLVIKKQ